MTVWPTPRLEPQHRTTYAMLQPLRTHTREARCDDPDVLCRGYRIGFSITCDVATELGERQAYYIRMHSGRAYTQTPPAGSLVRFDFPAGQQCFAVHRVGIWREPLYVVRNGDHRGNPRKERRVHARGEDWVDQFANHQGKLHTVWSRG